MTFLYSLSFPCLEYKCLAFYFSRSRRLIRCRQSPLPGDDREMKKGNPMYRYPLYLQTHRPLPVSSVKANMQTVEHGRRRPPIAPFRLTKVLLMIGFLLTAAAIAASVS